MEENIIPTVDSASAEQPQVEGDTQVEVSDSQEQPITETPNDGGQEDESFFDPNQVPEELKPAYKQMQSAFTKKTQEIANAKKESESLKERAEAYSKYEQYIPVIEEMLQKNQASTQSPELAALEQELRNKGFSDEAIEMMRIGSEFTLKTFNQKQSAAAESQRLTQGIDQAASLDKRLTDKSLVYQVGDGENVTFGEIVERYVMSDPKWQVDPVAATRKAIGIVDAMVSKAKTEGKEELSASAKQKATKYPQVNSSPQGARSTDQSTTVQDAFKEAKAELGL